MLRHFKHKIYFFFKGRNKWKLENPRFAWPTSHLCEIWNTILVYFLKINKTDNSVWFIIYKLWFMKHFTFFDTNDTLMETVELFIGTSKMLKVTSWNNDMLFWKITLWDRSLWIETMFFFSDFFCCYYIKTYNLWRSDGYT